MGHPGNSFYHTLARGGGELELRVRLLHPTPPRTSSMGMPASVPSLAPRTSSAPSPIFASWLLVAAPQVHIWPPALTHPLTWLRARPPINARQAGKRTSARVGIEASRNYVRNR
jgi:hypothetical protein